MIKNISRVILVFFFLIMGVSLGVDSKKMEPISFNKIQENLKKYKKQTKSNSVKTAKNTVKRKNRISIETYQ